MARAQENPSIKARTAIIAAISNGDVSASKWWLERKDKDEFATKNELAIEEKEPVQSE